MTKTPQQIKNEVEKGCGMKFDENRYYCTGEGGFTCPSCLAKLSILTEYDKSIKEIIDRLEKEYREAEIKQKGICPNVKEMTDGALIVLDRLREELLSKIGDNSEVEK
jgi:hypothetical protein